MFSSSAIARLFTVISSVTVLSGCITTPDSRPFNAVEFSHVQRIEALPMNDAVPSVLIVNHPGHSFGLIGALIAEGHMQPRRTWFRDQLQDAEFDHAGVFAESLEEAMRERGYELVWANGLVEDANDKIKRENWGGRSAVPAPSQTVDALMDISFGFLGYASAGSGQSSPYRPTVVVKARMVSPDGDIEMFFEELIYHQAGPVRQGIVLQPAPEHAYPNFEALQEAGNATVVGFELALRDTARALAEQFESRL